MFAFGVYNWWKHYCLNGHFHECWDKGLKNQTWLVLIVYSCVARASSRSAREMYVIAGQGDFWRKEYFQSKCIAAFTQIVSQNIVGWRYLYTEEHIVRRMLDVDIPGKRRRGRPNLGWKYTCKRDMTEEGLKEDKITNRAAWRNKIISYTGDPRWQARDEEDNTTNSASWRNKIISYTGDPRWRDKPGTKKTTQQTGHHGGIRSSAIPATPDDRTSQGRRRQHNKQGSMEE